MRWETLNAYVDGELAPDERRAVTDAARADPAVAARLATLARLKGTARVALAHQPRRSRPIAWRGGLGWASAAAVLACGLALLVARAPDASTDPAVAAFEAWSGTAPGPAGAVAAVPAAIDPPAIDSPATASLAPDLGGAGLTLVGRIATRHGRMTAYVGMHGCRLALWEAASEVDAERAETGSGVRVVRWAVGGRRFAVLSRGMDAGRFARIAAAIEAFTRARDPDRLRVALGATGADGRPCTG